MGITRVIVGLCGEDPYGSRGVGLAFLESDGFGFESLGVSGSKFSGFRSSAGGDRIIISYA